MEYYDRERASARLKGKAVAWTWDVHRSHTGFEESITFVSHLQTASLWTCWRCDVAYTQNALSPAAFSCLNSAGPKDFLR